MVQEMNRVALVTGGTGNIGKLIVRFLASTGYDVAFTYCENADEAVSMEHEIEKTGTRALALHCDFSKEMNFDEFLGSVQRRMGQIEVLILSASLFPGQGEDAGDERSVRHVFRANVESQFLLADNIARKMKSFGKGRIIFLLDTAGERIFTRFLPYSVSKAAGFAMVRGFAKAYAPEVQVNGVSPGIISRPGPLAEAEMEEVMKKIPAGRLGMSEEVAKTVLFLVQAPAYVTGEIIGVDGGYGL
jgi:NAD(P)-dependent dehydrogenase (short-subunit alcohol dehydrogenase family)